MRLPERLRTLRPARAKRPGSAARGAAQAAPRPILVGVNGSAAGTRALEWAVIRAMAGHTSLHIVHAFQPPGWLDPAGRGDWRTNEPGAYAYQLLDDAAERARHLDPGLQVSTSLRGVPAPAALIDEGRAAELIVLGQRHDRRRGTGWLNTTVTAQCGAASPGPRRDRQPGQRSPGVAPTNITREEPNPYDRISCLPPSPGAAPRPDSQSVRADDGICRASLPGCLPSAPTSAETSPAAWASLPSSLRSQR